MNRLLYFTLILMLVPVIFALGHSEPFGHFSNLESIDSSRHDATHAHQRSASQGHIDDTGVTNYSDEGSEIQHFHNIEGEGTTHRHGKTSLVQPDSPESSGPGVKINPPQYVHTHYLTQSDKNKKKNPRYHAHTKAQEGSWNSHKHSVWYNHSPSIDWDNPPDQTSIWDIMSKPDDEPIDHSHYRWNSNTRRTVWKRHTHAFPNAAPRYFHLGSEWSEHTPSIEWGFSSTNPQGTNPQGTNPQGTNEQNNQDNPSTNNPKSNNQGSPQPNNQGNPSTNNPSNQQPNNKGNPPADTTPKSNNPSHIQGTQDTQQQGEVSSNNLRTIGQQPTAGERRTSVTFTPTSPESLYYTELMALNFSPLGRSGQPQYFEIYNAGGTPVNFKGWKFIIEHYKKYGKAVELYRTYEFLIPVDFIIEPQGTVLFVTKRGYYQRQNLLTYHQWNSISRKNARLHQTYSARNVFNLDALVTQGKYQINLKSDWRLESPDGTEVVAYGISQRVSGWRHSALFGTHAEDGARRSLQFYTPEEPETPTYWGHQSEVATPGYFLLPEGETMESVEVTDWENNPNFNWHVVYKERNNISAAPSIPQRKRTMATTWGALKKKNR